MMMDMISRAVLLAIGAMSLLVGLFALTSRRPEDRKAAPGWLVLGAGLILVLVVV